MNKATVSVLVVGVVTVAVFNFASPVLARVLFNQSYSASWLLRKASVRCFFISCILVDFLVKTSPRWGAASTVTTIANNRCKQQVSRLSGGYYEEIQEWLARRRSSHYLAVYIDATFCSTRRDGSVSKEAYYTMLGLLPDGSREVLTVVNHPTEGAIAWEMELEALKERGVEQIDLIVSDALSGIENAVCSAFPTALHRLCVVHFKRKVLNTVSTKDKAEVGEELKALFPVEHTDITPLAAYENLRTFARRWGKKYPSLAQLDRERNTAYFTYLRFPENVRRMIYSTNWVERLNRCYKRTLLMRGAMPSPDSVVYLLGSVAKEKTEGTYARRLPYFREWKIK